MVVAARVGARDWYTDPGIVAPGVVSHAAGDEDNPKGATQLVGIAAHEDVGAGADDDGEGATQLVGITTHEDVGAGASDDGQAAGAGVLLESAMFIALSLANRSSKYAWSRTQGPTRGRGAAVGRSYCVTLV
jgi:hypothetical protein